MRNIDNETRITMNSRRNFVNYATMHLSNGEVLELTPSDFRIAGNSFTDDWVDGEAFQIGTTIGKTATILLDNTDGRVETIGSTEAVYHHGKFSEYDFYMAYFELRIHLPNATHYGTSVVDQVIPIGTFTVTTPTSHGATIEITGVDNMYMFDKSFDECDLDFSVSGGVSLLTILNKCCDDCGVGKAYSQTFTNYNLKVTKRPENATYRQVVSWVATMACSNAVITVNGDLNLKWYDMSTLGGGLDGGSFTAIGEEHIFVNKLTWKGENGAYENTGWNAYYNRIKRSGRYKITKVVISNIIDPSNFNGYFGIVEYDSFRDSYNNGVSFDASYRYNGQDLIRIPITEGENDINIDINISPLNKKTYWIGVGDVNYANPNESEFDAEIYIEPISYDDGDSADGGTFEPEILRNTLNWTLTSGDLEGDIRWRSSNFRCPDIISPEGKYELTRIYIDNIADISHFNATYVIQKSVDSGDTWTDEQSGAVVSGDNALNYVMTLSDNTVRYRVRLGQDVNADPNASSFTIRYYFKADDDVYLDGDRFDGGNFTTNSGFHNLTAINGTSISTDDIQFTGVSVKTDSAEEHYPTSSGWDYYAMIIEDNPFTDGHESKIAKDIYDAIKYLKFRPFTTSSIQDPTIEAGDACIVYDVKGNMYKSIITNVVFKTGGMTDLSCKAETPAKQGSRYVSQAAYAVTKAENKMNDYNSQVAHFNEIASAALGYYKTEEVSATDGSTITYLHNQPSLSSSQNVVKIANGVVAISDNYNTPQRSWNTGFDASTGTMLLNLIYVHGLTSDWINTGELNVGGVNNIDGVIHVLNEIHYFNSTWNGTVYWTGCVLGYSWIKPAGTYKITRVNISNISNPANFKGKYSIRVSRDGGSNYTVVREGNLVAGDNIINYVMQITETDDLMYLFYVGQDYTDPNSPTFDFEIFRDGVNTIIDKDGVEIRNGKIKLNGKDTFTTNANGVYMGDDGVAFGLYYDSHSNFEVDRHGNVYARAGELAGLLINTTEKGLEYNKNMGNGDRFFKLTAWSGITCGKESDGSHGTISGGWMRMDYVTDWGFLRVDYGNHEWGGITVTNVGNDNYANDGNNYIHIRHNKIYRDNENFSARSYVMWIGTDDTSDRRVKENIRPLSHDILQTIFDNLEPVIFNYIDDVKIPGTYFGVFAQDMEKALKEIGINDSPIVYEGDEDGLKHLSYHETIGILMGAVKDQYNIINEQQAEIDDLKERVKALEDIVKTKLG